METQTLRIADAAKILGIGRTAAYAAIKRGEIPSIRIGGIILVPKPALDKMLGSVPENPNKAEEIER